MNELKSCPFCGGEAYFIGESPTIKCKNCRVYLLFNPIMSKQEAIEAWNRRVDNG